MELYEIGIWLVAVLCVFVVGIVAQNLVDSRDPKPRSVFDRPGAPIFYNDIDLYRYNTNALKDSAALINDYRLDLASETEVYTKELRESQKSMSEAIGYKILLNKLRQETQDFLVSGLCENK